MWDFCYQWTTYMWMCGCPLVPDFAVGPPLCAHRHVRIRFWSSAQFLGLIWSDIIVTFHHNWSAMLVMSLFCHCDLDSLYCQKPTALTCTLTHHLPNYWWLGLVNQYLDCIVPHDWVQCKYYVQHPGDAISTWFLGLSDRDMCRVVFKYFNMVQKTWANGCRMESAAWISFMSFMDRRNHREISLPLESSHVCAAILMYPYWDSIRPLQRLSWVMTTVSEIHHTVGHSMKTHLCNLQKWWFLLDSSHAVTSVKVLGSRYHYMALQSYDPA